MQLDSVAADEREAFTVVNLTVETETLVGRQRGSGRARAGSEQSQPGNYLTSSEPTKFIRGRMIGHPPSDLDQAARCADYPLLMVFANATTLGAAPGKRDELVSHLTERNDALLGLGCLLYEVGVNDEDPDAVFVVELWDSASAHQASLADPEVQASIATSRPLLSGKFDGFRFNVVGSPLRD